MRCLFNVSVEYCETCTKNYDAHGINVTAPPIPAPILIGIAGKARSGKDTIADVLAEALSFDRYSFATPIKEMIKAGLGLEDKEDEKAEQLYGCSYRKLAQTLGTEWGRDQINNKIWINIAHYRLQGKRAIVSDVRFESEADFIRQYGILIHVERYGVQRIEENDHVSEQGVGILHGEYKIMNSSTGLEQFKHMIWGQVVPDMKELLKHKKVWGLDAEPTTNCINCEE